MSGSDPSSKTPASPGAPGGGSSLAWQGLVAVLAVGTYFYGLDGQHIPKNGDECPYEHIARLTAGSGRLLPLRSELPDMRNTKPPLLFWQGIASTDGGRNWTLWNLRYPSVLYTLLTAGTVFLLAWKLSDRVETGFVGGSSFLAFFSTYRFGRPFLTSPAEVLWLGLPFFALLYWQPLAFDSRFVFPVLAGLAIGLALLYKSFALAAPVSLGLAWWYVHHRRYRLATFLAKDLLKTALAGSIALALFGAWFLLDPDPGAIWREFVLKENLGKFASPGGYGRQLLVGASSIWSLALGYPLNAGLLAVPVLALFLIAFKRRHELPDAEKLLWIWILTLFLTFGLPSQRSSRYLLPAMPALAVLLALNWQRISRRAFAVALLLTATAVTAIAYASIRLQAAAPGGVRPYGWGHWLLLMGTESLIVVGLARPRLTHACVNAAILLGFLCFAHFLRPFEGPLGRYDPQTQQYLRGKEVGVPYNFIAGEERYRFLLPGADLRGYRERPELTTPALLARYPIVAVRQPLADPAPPEAALLGQRLDLKGRHDARELGELLRGGIDQQLFMRELLLTARPRASGPGDPAPLSSPR
ncbi:MAG TPA: glycosyl transferase family 39 [Vicinamibacteria bacterium]|nr:glycosyl transferase family 39 [Vicinamibacteria bacterium]